MTFLNISLVFKLKKNDRQSRDLNSDLSNIAVLPVVCLLTVVLLESVSRSRKLPLGGNKQKAKNTPMAI